jgi:hypothetical protein
MKFEDALALAQSKRSKINPNTGFRQQLKDYEEFIKSSKNDNYNGNMI